MEFTAQTLLLDFSLIGVLLLIGTFLRNKISFLQKFLIPASVIGGILGMILGPHVLNVISFEAARLSSYSTEMVVIVFAALFIGKTLPKVKDIVSISGAQTIFAVICNFMQIAIGMGTVVLFGLFAFDLHPGFGMQMILAFQGGPGIPTAFAPMYEQLGWVASEAQAVGETIAVMGLLMGVIIGIVLVNIGVRRGFPLHKGKGAVEIAKAVIPEEKRPSIGKAIINTDAISPLGFAFTFLGLAVFAGYWAKYFAQQVYDPLKFVPLFPFALVMGLVLQFMLQRGKLDKLVDRNSVVSIQGFALDILIVAAISGIAPQLVLTYAAPLLVVFGLGLLWNMFWAMYLAPRMLPGAWFEKGVAEFGQATASVPVALLLLRAVDPELRTDAADAFAIKMFLTSPTMVPLMATISAALASNSPLQVMLYALAGSLALFALTVVVGWRYSRSSNWLKA